MAAGGHSILQSGYQHGGGEVGDFAEWWAAVRNDPEFDPAGMFLAIDANGTPVGFAHCWSSAYLKDIAVESDWRRKGVGRALILTAMEYFASAGAKTFRLKVRSDNSSAERLYRQLGMVDG